MIVDNKILLIEQHLAEIANEAKRYQCLRRFTASMLSEVNQFCNTEDMAFDSVIDRIRAARQGNNWQEAWQTIQDQIREEIKSGHCVGYRGLGKSKL